MPLVLAWIASAHLSQVPGLQTAMLTIACGWEGGFTGSAGRSHYATATCVKLSPTSNPLPANLPSTHGCPSSQESAVKE